VAAVVVVVVEWPFARQARTKLSCFQNAMRRRRRRGRAIECLHSRWLASDRGGRGRGEEERERGPRRQTRISSDK